MKKLFFYIFLVLFISCTANNISTEIIDYDKTYSSFIISIDKFIELAKQNKKEEIDSFYIHTLENRVIFNEIKKQDLSKILIFIPKNKIEVITNNRVQSLIVVNSGIISSYFDVAWIRDKEGWKISKVYERQE